MSRVPTVAELLAEANDEEDEGRPDRPEIRARHRAFGFGALLSVETKGRSAQLLTHFDKGGEKWIAFGLASLSSGSRYAGAEVIRHEDISNSIQVRHLQVSVWMVEAILFIARRAIARLERVPGLDERDISD